ncbi:class I SAM-dependent methyltransferase [Thiomonas intermedia]|uniref:class I SAM-dependent methyltransferase n=1 Tax=Thiomonas intermedia TaxID=926 RepID=UPI001C54C82E|nr:class I SAM-dependent methyltransferase [Thiomonas intermedia]
MPDVWTMHYCENCHSIYLNPRPDATSLPAAYEDYLTHVEQNTYEEIYSRTGIFWTLVRGYLRGGFNIDFDSSCKWGYLIIRSFPPARQKLDRFCRNLNLNRLRGFGRLLDVGCGNGAFLAFAEKMGWKAEGVEPDPVAANLCAEKGLDVRCGFIDEMDDRQGVYDVLTMNHVIEHAANLDHIMIKSFALLRPGGLLWIALPNPNGLGLKMFGAAFSALHPPYHLCLYSQRSLRDAMHRAGFDGVRVIRRGFHARVHWRDSLKISKKYSLAIPHAQIRYVVRWISDFLSVFTPRWSEETVIIAYRPINS